MITFLNPGLLFALSLISLPILIHLFNLRKVRKVEFSTLMFLKEIQKSKLKKIKLKQWILLLLRILFIIFLVLSFSNPVFEGYSSGAGMLKQVVIVIDDSFSMDSRDASESSLDLAKKSAKEILSLYGEKDRVYVIPSSFIARKDTGYVSGNSDETVKFIDRLSTSYKSISYAEVMEYASALFSENKNYVNEIFIVSDFQKSNFLNPLPEVTQKENNYLYLVDAGKPKSGNISVGKPRVVSTVLQKDKAVKISVEVTNYNDYNVFNKTLGFYLNGEKLEDRVVDIESNKSLLVEFETKKTITGSNAGNVTLSQNEFRDDGIAKDNTAYFDFYIPAKIRVALLTDAPSETRFLKAVFGALNETDKNYIEIKESSSLNESALQSDVIFIAGKRNISASDAAVLEKYLANRGGICVFPPRDADTKSYNDFFRRVNSAQIGNLYIVKDTSSASRKYNKIDFEHPVLNGIFKNKTLSITSEEVSVESPKINSEFDIPTGENSSALITLKNLKTFLAESKASSGKIILFSVSAGSDMSDFPATPIFAPLVYRIASYLSGNTAEDVSRIVGKLNIIRLKDAANYGILEPPDKKRITFASATTNGRNTDAPRTDGKNADASLTDKNNSVAPLTDFFALTYIFSTRAAGIYTLIDSARNSKYSFAVNYNEGESKPDKAESKFISAYFANAGVKSVNYIGAGANRKESITTKQKGFSLWQYFLALSLVFLLAEILYSKKLEEN